MGLPAHKLDEFPGGLDPEVWSGTDEVVDDYVPKHRGEPIEEEEIGASLLLAPEADVDTPSEARPQVQPDMARDTQLPEAPEERLPRLRWLGGVIWDGLFPDGFGRAEMVGVGAVLAAGGLAIGAAMHGPFGQTDESEYHPIPDVRIKTTPQDNTLKEVMERYGRHHGWTKKQADDAALTLANGFSAQGWVKIPASQSGIGKAINYKSALLNDTQKLIPYTKIQIDGGSLARLAPQPHFLDHPGY